MKRTLIALCVLLIGCSDSREFRLQQLLLKGNLSLKENNTQQAAYYFKEALKIEPCFKDALNNLGTIDFQQNLFEEAINKYNKAIACDAKFLPAYFNRANTYYELKAYFKAQQDVDRIIAEKPDTAVVYFLQGLIATKMRDFPVALTAFDKALRLDGSNVEYLVNRGTVKYYLRQLDDAQKDLEKAERLNPKEPNIYNTLSMIAISRGNYDGALTLIGKSLSLAPNQPYYLNNRGFVLLMKNRNAEAMQDIDQSILLDAENGWAYRNKGIYYMSTGDAENSIRMLKQALSMDNFIDGIHFYLGSAYLKNNQRKEACDQFRQSEKASEMMVTDDLRKLCQ